VALKVAPEQGWGLHWNEAHPDRPFTLVEVGPAPYVLASPTGSSQATPAVSAPAMPQAGAPAAQSAPALQAVAVPGVVTELHIPVGLQGGGTQIGSATLSDSGSAGEGPLAPLTFGAHWSDGWFVVPSAANEYGQAHAALEGGFEFDVATGSFTSDWFWV